MEPRPPESVLPLREGKAQKIFLGFGLAILVLVLANLIFLDLLSFGLLESSQPEMINEQSEPAVPASQTVEPSEPVFEPVATVSQVNNEEDVCPQSCLDVIQAGQQAAEGLPQEPVEDRFLAKVHYIPLGSGSTASTDWQAMTGAEAVIDLSHFTRVKSIIWEAVIYVPTGNGQVQAKLFNLSDKHDVWFSQVSTGDPDPFRAESAEIKLDEGRKLYRVMMKSTMGYEAILSSARIKIILE